VANLKGFFSYTHADDESEHGRITRLAKDIVEEYKLISGDEVELFVDKENLEWGDQWRNKIEEYLASIAFFIPVITPRYFKSPECRSELQRAIGMSKFGNKNCILPIIYVDFDEPHGDSPSDELKKSVKSFQWERFDDTRLCNVDSERYRRQIAECVKRLVKVNKQVDDQISPLPILSEDCTNKNIADDSPGDIDSLADYEDKLGQFPNTVNAIRDNIEKLGTIASEGTEEIHNANTHNKPFTIRQIILRQVAQKMIEPTNKIQELSNEYVSQLHSIDIGLRIIIGRASFEVTENPDGKSNFQSFFKLVRDMSIASNGATKQFQSLLIAIEPLEKASRDLRPVVRNLKLGLTILIESDGIFSEWINLIEMSGIESN